ncbi:hypothetical protein QBC41DRAFT_395267 [Cercophora samala]|uniref:Uncharacterized protein n=1 Tax=Cercophora samala TaxID=330535 RepID=A0AA40DBM6_9PEZI|nr:hypothetical protein QBC41DRAFT_395267 [Cercophora samala]
MPRRSVKLVSAGVDPTPRRSTRLASRESVENKHHLEGQEEATGSESAAGERTRPDSSDGEEEEEDPEASVYPASSPSERQPSPLEEYKHHILELELESEYRPEQQSSSSPPQPFLHKPPRSEIAMDSPEPYLRGGANDRGPSTPGSQRPRRRSPETRRSKSPGQTRPRTPGSRREETAGSPRHLRTPETSGRKQTGARVRFKDPETAPPRDPAAGKVTKAEFDALQAAAQALVEAKYVYPDHLRYQLGNLETSVKPRLAPELKKHYQRNDTDPVVVAQRAELLAIQEPLLKVYGDPQRDPADAAKDGRVLDGVRSWLDEVVLGRERVRPCGRSVARELLGAWKPTQLEFNFTKPRDGEEIGNEWFGAVWQDLYLKASHFGEEYFGEGLGFGEEVPNGGDIGDLKKIDKVWTTGVGGSKNLVWFISQVARQDNGYEGGWDVMLSKAVQRKLLVVGVLGKVLERQVFDDLLFGADQEARDMLEAADKALEASEGYRRTRLRAEKIDMYMNDRQLTPEFWSYVDMLSIQITTLLLPLLNLMDQNFNNSRAKSLQGFHQKIHDIVAEAGFLSLHMAHSKNIFRISAPFLGQAWAIDQNNVDDRVFDGSASAVAKLEAKEKQKWAKEQVLYKNDPENYRPEPTWREKASNLGFRRVLWAILGFIPSLLYWRVKTYGEFPPWDSKPDVKGTVWKSPPYLAKVQIVVWPKCERYGLMGDIDPELKTSREGESISTLLKSQVVYYQGRTDKRGLSAENTPTLLDWLKYKDALWWKKWWDRLVDLGFTLFLLYQLARLVPIFWLFPQVCLALAKLLALVILDILIRVLTWAITATKIVMYVTSAIANTIMGWLGLALPESDDLSWTAPSFSGRKFRVPGYNFGVGDKEFEIPGFEGQTYSIPWLRGKRGRERKPDYLDEVLSDDFAKRQKELEAEKEKTRQRARERAKELERLQREKELEEEDDIEVTKVVEKIFPGPITPPPSKVKTPIMTLKKSWLRAGEEPGPDVWEEHTPGYFEILTEKAKELPLFKDKAKEKLEEQRRLAEWRKERAEKEGEVEGEEDGEWQKYVKPDWFKWFGAPTEEELRLQEQEKLAWEAAQEAARREKETRKERRKREREEARLKKLREAEAKEKKELEEIQRKERELELEIARRRKEPKAPAKVRPEFKKEVFKKWWDTTVGDLGLGWKELIVYYPTVTHHLRRQAAEDSGETGPAEEL